MRRVPATRALAHPTSQQAHPLSVRCCRCCCVRRHGGGKLRARLRYPNRHRAKHVVGWPTPQTNRPTRSPRADVCFATATAWVAPPRKEPAATGTGRAGGRAVSGAAWQARLVPKVCKKQKDACQAALPVVARHPTWGRACRRAQKGIRGTDRDVRGDVGRHTGGDVGRRVTAAAAEAGRRQAAAGGGRRQAGSGRWPTVSRVSRAISALASRAFASFAGHLRAAGCASVGLTPESLWKSAGSLLRCLLAL